MFRILLVEDNTVNQVVARQMLDKLGHHVVIASNGREALERLTELPPFDLILMDIQMPEMDGFQTTTAIREMETAHASHTPIIALTANVMKGDRERCLAAGMDGYVSKPVHSKALHEAIQAVMLDNGLASSQTNPEVESPAFDRSAFFNRLGGDENLVKNVVRLFMEDYPGHLSKIRRAIHTCESTTLTASAHALKGSLLTLSADEAASVAQKLEEIGRSGELTAAAEVSALLESEITKVLAALQKMVSELA